MCIDYEHNNDEGQENGNDQPRSYLVNRRASWGKLHRTVQLRKEVRIHAQLPSPLKHYEAPQPIPKGRRVTGPLDAAVAAHKAARAAQASMRAASRERDAAVHAARAAGVPAAELAAALGVNRHRIAAMMKQAKGETK